MRSSLFSLIALLILSQPSQAAFKSMEALSQWTTFYYQNPKPTELPDFIEYLSKSGMLDNQNALSPIFGFLAGTFKNNPEQITPTLNKITAINTSHTGVVVLGIWYANLPDSKKIVYGILESNQNIKKDFEFLYTGNPMAIEKIPLEQGPWVLDSLWGNFMATGNKAPVQRLISALPWVDIKDDIGRKMVGGAAQWSLTSNAIQHPLVLTICEQSVTEVSFEVAEKLRQVIENAKKELN